MNEIRFFCESCGDKVKPRDKFCPSCGSFFSNVRCPACNFQGDVGYFLHGCPQCGYSGKDAKSNNKDGIELHDWPQELTHSEQKNPKKENKIDLPLIVVMSIGVLTFIGLAIYVLSTRR